METENQKLRARVEELSRETMLLAHTITDLTAKLKLATSTATQPVDAAQAVPKLATQLREYAGNPGYSHGDYADAMRQAADALDTTKGA